MVSDTIFALSSGRPPAGIAVIRISGPAAFSTVARFTERPAPFAARRAVLCPLKDPENGELLDRALILCFPGPHSVTGEDLAEWHCHGGQAVVRAVLDALGREAAAGQGVLRPAEAGEFTRRAFENGRIDLNEAEGLADLLAAETETQRRTALRMAEGHFSRRLDEWRTRLLRCSAWAESLLDFSDEDDIADAAVERHLRETLADLAQGMRTQLAAPSAERLRDGVRLVLAGPPNAGKSTLLNALAGREAAIVSDIAGTTRDRIEVPVSLEGIAFVLTDTAGLAENSSDAIERIGIDRAGQAIAEADILLWLGDPAACPRADAIKLATQMDRPERSGASVAGADLAISAKSGFNMDALHRLLVERARTFLPGEDGFALHRRQRDAVGRMAEELDAAKAQPDLLLVAEHLRRARAAMDRLVGRSGVEDMLDALFGQFCVGK